MTVDIRLVSVACIWDLKGRRKGTRRTSNLDLGIGRVF